MKRVPRGGFWLFFLVIGLGSGGSACGGQNKPDDGGRPIDSGRTNDAPIRDAPTLDAPHWPDDGGIVPDAPRPDAPVPDASSPDASSPDASVPDVASICAAACAALEVCNGPDPSCVGDCNSFLPVCSGMERLDFYNCISADCNATRSCMLPLPCGFCGDGLCQLNEEPSYCGQDCGGDPYCGDGWCDPIFEDVISCSVDCAVCGDRYCQAFENCPFDCDFQVCGNGLCEYGEHCESCPVDCGACVCGDGTCDVGECGNCAADCPGGCNCSHDECVQGAPLDAACNSCTADMCLIYPFCCTNSWDLFCVQKATYVCGRACDTTICGNGLCTYGEDINNCPIDCTF